uniref:F-box/FBD/LRR-repeat protein At1g13570-like n=1 Tax=Nicotiana tabacum TaxID=4097 RepID=A0A1S4D8G5_TOBAC|nr:PREDICTED: F-box/FBD/LRR-repeat protein At1g13570-like [Nicotiana tabacum]
MISDGYQGVWKLENAAGAAVLVRGRLADAEMEARVLVTDAKRGSHLRARRCEEAVVGAKPCRLSGMHRCAPVSADAKEQFEQHFWPDSFGNSLPFYSCLLSTGSDWQEYYHMMCPDDNQHCSETLPLDVLSYLPENILDNILVCLPLRDAVRTSILSKKWRCKWCRLPVLTLDQALWETTNNSIPLAIRFIDIIYDLLTLHVGPITQFTLSSIADLGNYPKIDKLVSFLSRNGIQHLALQFPKDNPYKLPSSFFTCSQMRHLRLHNCSIHPPHAFRGFNELVSLELYDITFSSELFNILISLPVAREVGAANLNINDISLKKAPLLVKLSLFNTGVPSGEAGQLDLAKYFESFPALEHLYLNYLSVRFLAAGSGDIPAKLSSSLHCLKHLCLTNICLDELAELSYALCLIRSSPYLQDIQMKVGYVALDKVIDPVPGDVVNDIPASFSDVTLNHLRVVNLEGITGTKPEIELIKLLLAKSPMLVKMLIQPNKGKVFAETRLKVLAEITKFPRASSKAEVHYNIDNNLV